MSDVRARIESAAQKLAVVMNQGNISAAAALYTSNARVLPPNGEIVQGRAAIQSLFQAMLEMGCKDITFKTVEIEVHETIAYHIGTYTMTLQPSGSEPVTDKGKYVEIWKPEEGDWKIVVDIFNSSLPASH